MEIETWLLLALLAASLKSVQSTWQKIETQTHSSLEIATVPAVVAFALYSVMVTVMGVPVTSGLTQTTGLLLAATAGGNVVGLWAFIQAVEKGDLSVASPVKQTTPVWVAVIEPLVVATTWSLSVFAASVLTVVGATLVVSDPRTLSVRDFRSKTVLYAGVTAVTFSVSAVLGSLLLETLSLAVFLFWLYFGVSVAFVVLHALSEDRIIPRTSVRVVGLGVVLAFNIGLSFYTISLTSAANATIVFRASMLVNIGLGAILFGETEFKRRFIGGIVIVAGILIVVV